GNPFLLAIISSPDNLTDLDHLRRVNAQISDPEGLTEEAVRELVREGRAVVCQTMSMHATEIGGTQMAPELAYDLLSDSSEDTLNILDNVIFLMVPCFNPDGQLMVADWYEKYLGTEYEGCNLPWLYHKYAGHDNNRDAFMLNIPESRYVGQILFRQWKPQAYQDHHHMGSYGARFYVAPYCNPIHPHADPLIWREHAWFGAHMAYKLEENGKKGILNAAQFPGWGHLGFHWITAYHNIAGMLTESASAKLASPLYIHPDQLTGASPRTMPDYEAQTNFPNPWEGGWWRLRDIVEQKKIAARAVLELCAHHRETVLYNAYLKARRQAERGRQSDVRAFVIDAGQHDPLTGSKLVQILLNQGIEVSRAEAEFRADGRVYPAGTHVVPLAQPKMGLIRTLLDRTLHPDSYWTRHPDGSPVVFDTASDTVAEYMGVKVTPVRDDFEGEFTEVGEVIPSAGRVSPSPHGYIFDGRLNDSYAAANALLRQGLSVSRTDEPLDVEGEHFPRGSFVVSAGDGVEENLREGAADLGVSFCGLVSTPQMAMHAVRSRRTGIYQRYWGGNADEGWTRFVFDQFGFAYSTLTDDDIRAGSLSERYDVIIIPSDPEYMIVDVSKAGDDARARYLKRFEDALPPEYRSGIGDEGVRMLGEFVRDGGRLIAFDQAWSVAARACSLKVENAVAEMEPKEYYTHGSTLHCTIDSSHPLGYGMPEDALVFSWDSAVFEIHEAVFAEKYEVIARYPREGLLQSGKLVGENKIAGRPAMLRVSTGDGDGDGDVVLIGFRCQHRAQTHGTYKLLFNCLL
ncbi:MAG: M14 family metallopeptidase, partial [Bacillota bacterium]